MTLKEHEHFIELIPTKGKFLANKELTEVYEASIILGKFDSAENYVEVTALKASKIIAANSSEEDTL